MEVAHRWIWEQMHPSKEQQEANAFMRKLKNRQGTIAPDFAELYRRKAEIDGR